MFISVITVYLEIVIWGRRGGRALRTWVLDQIWTHTYTHTHTHTHIHTHVHIQNFNILKVHTRHYLEWLMYLLEQFKYIDILNTHCFAEYWLHQIHPPPGNYSI